MDRILIILKKENGPRASSAPALGLNTRDVNKYLNVRIFSFHTNILMRFLDSNIRIIF